MAYPPAGNNELLARVAKGEYLSELVRYWIHGFGGMADPKNTLIYLDWA